MKKLQRFFAMVLAVSMLMSLLSVTAFADEEGSAPPSAIQIVKKGEDQTSEDKKVTFSKHIEGTDTENVFDITLNVTTKEDIQKIYSAQPAAVVLVMDMSFSMFRHVNNDGTNTRYTKAAEAANDFIDRFCTDAAENSDVFRQLSIVAFNTDAYTVSPFTDCSNGSTAATGLKNELKQKAENIAGRDVNGKVDVYTGEYKDTCEYYTDSAKQITQYTNIEGGLKLAENLLNNVNKNVNKYVILLTDGFPTTYIEGSDTSTNKISGKNPRTNDLKDALTGKPTIYGTSYSDTAATKAANAAASLKTKATVFTVGVNVGGQTMLSLQRNGRDFSVVETNVTSYGTTPTYDSTGKITNLSDDVITAKHVIGEEGNTINDSYYKTWLAKKICTDTSYYADGDNDGALKTAFDNIFKNIEELNQSSVAPLWVASDPMGTTTTQSIDFLQFWTKGTDTEDAKLVDSLNGTPAGENTATFENDEIKWDLKKSGYIYDDNAKTYTYTLKYRVRLATEVKDFSVQGEYETNGTTKLEYRIVENGIPGDEQELEVKVPSVKGYVGEFSFKKVDSVTDAALPGATFTLKHNENCAYCKADGVTHPDEMHAAFGNGYLATSDETGLVSFKGIPSGHTYTLQETKAPDGYKLSNATYTVTVAYGETKVNGSVWTADTTVKNVPDDKTVQVSGTKTWDDNNDQDGKRPGEITVHLFADGEDTGKTATVTADKDGNWTYSFTGLDKYADNGKEINYTVTEDAVDGYTTVIDGYNITNSHTPDKTSVTVTKRWDDANDQDGKRPGSITVQLYANGTASGEPVTLSASNNWTYTWEDLAKNNSGTAIDYTVNEVSELPDNYSKEVSGSAANGYIITNSYTPETTSVSGSKTWVDDNDRDGLRPDSITVRLLADGEDTGKTATASKENNWSYSFTDLPKYDKGVEIKYTVDENPVEGYTPAYTETNNGFDITNTHEIGKNTITVKKVWNDGNDQDGIRPDEIWVQLWADNEAHDPVALNAANNWEYTWSDLPLKNNGTAIVYKAEELGVKVVEIDMGEGTDAPTEKVTYKPVEGYTTEIDGFTITNSHTPAVTSVSGTKTWKNDSEKNRPESITVRLYADGKEVDSMTVTAEDEWTYGFYQLPKNANGVEITYTVTEDKVEGYKAPTYTETENGWDITNTKRTTTSPDPTPATTTVSGTKKWKNDSEENRPDSITVRLYADGKEVDSKTVTAKDGWKFKFTGLDKYAANDKLITYTVSEDEVEGYTTTVSGHNITNTYEPTEPTDPTPTPPDPNENIPDGSTPTTNTPSGTPSENIPDDIPGANVPRTGDPFSPWAALSALSGAGLLLTSRRKREDEEN